MRRVLAAVVNWNGGPHVVRCIGSLLSQSGVSVSCLLVDNASVDGSVEAIRARFPQVAIRILPENTGYAGGVNAAVQQFLTGGFDYLFVLNNDVECHPECLRRLTAGIPNSDDVAVVGPGRLRHHDGMVSRGGKDMGAWKDHLAFDNSPRSVVASRGHQVVDRILGCAMLISRGAVERLGGFDSRMFLNWEEVDFCLRVWRVGGFVAVVADAEVLHDEGTTAGRYPEILFYYLNRNRMIAAKRNLRVVGIPAELVEHLKFASYEIVVMKRWYYRALLLAIVDGAVLALNTSRDPRVAMDLGIENAERNWRFRP